GGLAGDVCSAGDPPAVVHEDGVDRRERPAAAGERALERDRRDSPLVAEEYALTRSPAADVRNEGNRSVVVEGRGLECRESPAARDRRALERDGCHCALVDDEYALTRGSAGDVRHEGDHPVVVHDDGVERGERPAP